jgi:hypothetical protein
MSQAISALIASLIQSQDKEGILPADLDPLPPRRKPQDQVELANQLTRAFLFILSDREGEVAKSQELFSRMADSGPWASVVQFYRKGLDCIGEEIESSCQRDPAFLNRLDELTQWVQSHRDKKDTDRLSEKVWAFFFPEGTGIRGHEAERIAALRSKRTVRLTEPNGHPIHDAAREILFTSNVLLTIPHPDQDLSQLPLGPGLRRKLDKISLEHQDYWFDHPIQIGVRPEQNEVLYGLHGLEKALAFEKNRGSAPEDAKIACLLSVSVTHCSLQESARAYLVEELAKTKPLEGIRLYMYTEADAQRIRDDILIPAADHYGLAKGQDFEVFGVDGEYGRHYTFLKAMAAFWHVLLDPAIRGTFKIDLDQVFPQELLADQAGASAFELMQTPLWGAQGLDDLGRPLELGMIAGALVNEKCASRSLFTPDVPFPNRPLAPDEYIFFSTLPQALSTEAEMMTRSGREFPGGEETCLQRIHVTGGTNGILVDSLRRHRPFTPSFIGRAEDQAYLLSVLLEESPQLAYVHREGLIMRHDKEAFAQEAIETARVSKLVGDYIRILYYSAYGRVLSNDISPIKERVDPFTGCFISHIPYTVVFLRFALKAMWFFTNGEGEQGVEFVTKGAPRILETIRFIHRDESPLEACYERERRAWHMYYDTLAAIEHGLKENDSFAGSLKKKAETIAAQCCLCP